MKVIAAAAVVILLAGCAHVQQPKQSIPVAVKAPAKHMEPCSCSQTANQVIAKRWYDGFRVKWFH